MFRESVSQKSQLRLAARLSRLLRRKRRRGANTGRPRAAGLREEPIANHSLRSLILRPRDWKMGNSAQLKKTKPKPLGHFPSDPPFARSDQNWTMSGLAVCHDARRQVRQMARRPRWGGAWVRMEVSAGHPQFSSDQFHRFLLVDLIISTSPVCGSRRLLHTIQRALWRPDWTGLPWR